MTLVLQSVSCLAILVLTVYLVLLLHQARRTAAAVEKLADSAARDLDQVADDVHAMRVRLDETAGLVRQTLELPTALTQVVSGVVRAMPVFFRRKRGEGAFLENLLTGFQTALHLFRTPKTPSPKEEHHE